MTTESKRRPEGRRVKHRLRRNSIKMYDKASVLRVETTINNPREFKVLRQVVREGERSRRWMAMGKGVANLWRYYQVARGANQRYLEALSHVPLKGKAVAALDGLCRCAHRNGKHVARFEPFSAVTCALFTAVLTGEHALAGLRNKDLVRLLYRAPARTPEERRRRCARVSRLIAKLRAHGLLHKVKDSRLYRPSPEGLRLMTTVVRLRNREFPAEYRATG